MKDGSMTQPDVSTTLDTQRQKVVIDGVELMLTHPDELSIRWIGAEGLRDQLIAAWMVVGKEDLPLNPRLLGKPGVGKTTLAYSVARDQGREVYIYQCTMDTRPEDLLVTPVISGEGKIAYHASALVTAMLRGEVCILDEANRMSEKSWASLAPLLDQRRYIESIITGLKIKAHPDFRIVCTMNDDASTYEVPEYIQSRLQPQIEITFPTREEEKEILRFNIPFSGDQLLEMAVDFLQKAHEHNLRFTTRDGVNIMRYCIKLAKRRDIEDPRRLFEDSVQGVLGADGLDFLNGIIPSSARLHPYLDDDDFDDLMDDDPDDEGDEWKH